MPTNYRLPEHAGKRTSGSVSRVAVASVLWAAMLACGDTISFDELSVGLVHGSVLATQYSTSHGVTFSCFNNGRTNTLVIYDTEVNSSADPDLNYPWFGGNLTGMPVGNIMIIEENVTASEPTVIANPDDDARGGTIYIEFDYEVKSFGFDQVDSDSGEDFRIGFYRNGTQVGTTIVFSDFTTPGNALYDSTIAFGDHKANRIQPLTVADIGGTFDEVRFTMSGSGGFTNLIYEEVPEPATGLLLGVSLCLVFLRRRRR